MGRVTKEEIAEDRMNSVEKASVKRHIVPKEEKFL
jgi:hypothetical protein